MGDLEKRLSRLEAARILRTTERTAGSFCHGLPFRSHLPLSRRSVQG
jgi:hypothetical protein